MRVNQRIDCHWLLHPASGLNGPIDGAACLYDGRVRKFEGVYVDVYPEVDFDSKPWGRIFQARLE